MNPCRGCKDNMERVMVKLRFIGKPGGKLVKGAPGNYEQGQVIIGPADKAVNFPKIWVLLEKMPELVIPELTDDDSVFDLGIPKEVEESAVFSGEFNLLDPDRSSSRSLVRVDSDSTDSEQDEISASEASPTVEDLESSTKAQLMAFLDSQGAEYKSRMKKAEILELAKSLL
jgi:hypothetical protein